MKVIYRIANAVRKRLSYCTVYLVAAFFSLLFPDAVDEIIYRAIKHSKHKDIL